MVSITMLDRVVCALRSKNENSISYLSKEISLKLASVPTTTHKNNETNDKIYRKVAFLMYTEMVNFTPQS